MLLSHKTRTNLGESLQFARVRRLSTVFTLVCALALSIVSCARGRIECPRGTATFPIAGVVVRKENPTRGCYLLYVRRDNRPVSEVVRVSRFRYTHVNLDAQVAYTAQPTD